MESRRPFDDLERYAPPPRPGLERDGASAEPGRVPEFVPPRRRPRLARAFQAACVVALTLGLGVLAFVDFSSPEGPTTPPPVLPAQVNLAEEPAPRLVLGYPPRRARQGRAERPARRERDHDRKRKGGRDRVHDDVVVAGPAPAQPPPAPQPEPRPAPPQKRKDEKKTATRAKPERPVPTHSLYHLYHRKKKDHFYTIDPTVKKQKMDAGWGLLAIEGRMFDDYEGGSNKPLITENGIVGYMWKEREKDSAPLHYFTGPQGDYYTSDWRYKVWMEGRKYWKYHGVIGWLGAL